MENEAVILFCLTKGHLDDIPAENILEFEKRLYSDMATSNAGKEIAEYIRTNKQLPADEVLVNYINEFKNKSM